MKARSSLPCSEASATGPSYVGYLTSSASKLHMSDELVRIWKEVVIHLSEWTEENDGHPSQDSNVPAESRALHSNSFWNGRYTMQAQISATSILNRTSLRPQFFLATPCDCHLSLDTSGYIIIGRTEVLNRLINYIYRKSIFIID